MHRGLLRASRMGHILFNAGHRDFLGGELRSELSTSRRLYTEIIYIQGDKTLESLNCNNFFFFFFMYLS